jgi:hypothetical protein
MYWVEFEGHGPENRELTDDYDVLRTHIHCDVASPPFRLTVTSDSGPRLFSVDRERGVFVSTHQSEGICRYAGIERSAYFRLCALLGRVQWRALELNPLLVEEDFSHQVPSRCLFAPQQYKEDYALVLEDPQVCHGCMEFYHCLAAEAEILALQTMLSEIRAARR